MKTSTKESMVIKAATVKFPITEKKNSDKVENQRASSNKWTLKEMQEKEFPFPDFDVPHIFDELLVRKLIESPQSKRPEEAGKTNDPKYCKYHQLVRHTIEKYFMFKDNIMALAKEENIVLDIEDVARANLVNVMVTQNTLKEILQHEEQKVNRILIDGGSAVNIMSKSTMKRLKIPVEDLSPSRLTIQGFNQDGQRAIGMIRLNLMIGELKVSTLFHVIDARTFYYLLLGRPWLHENRVIPSTLHQCFKYVKD
ncbi:hypothetical protein CDL12_13655 [Handroanthus impetiginosus]|uniref:Peptidase A2 domain-containing protein n=1 Tax=Handroanthus impetiginosus TaxID=429701 RepID=A0A2G9H880_9LAMI|nr:hypothetical protein CDL12_13655 [Handroanthus impetiginosus]